MRAAHYPPANWKGDGVSGGSYIGAPWRFVVHTTETTGVPGYNTGRSAPHITYNPKTRTYTQHTELTTAARALKNAPGGVETNRANALQLEVVCYSAKTVADQSLTRLWVGHLPEHVYADLHQLRDWVTAEYGIKAEWPGRQALSYSQANAPGFRFTGPAWNTFNGFCGHQHVGDGNTHWDPGAFDWTRFLEQGDETMRVREFVEGLAQATRPDGTNPRIDQLVDAKIIAGGTPTAVKKYWTGLLANPDNPEWANFVSAFEVATALNAATAAKNAGAGGGSAVPLVVSLTGTAKPV